MQMFTSTSLVRCDGNEGRADVDELVAEEPLEIRVAGRAVSVTMRTPGHDAELALGFLLSEGVIRRRADMQRIHSCAGANNLLNVTLDPRVTVDLEKLTRHVFAASSCGLCGKATIEAISAQLDPIDDATVPRIPAAVIAGMPDEMRKTQATFDRTGGLHAAALFDYAGRLLVVREDVGRHNAVDKVLGHALLNDWMPGSARPGHQRAFVVRDHAEGAGWANPDCGGRLGSVEPGRRLREGERADADWLFAKSADECLLL